MLHLGAEPSGGWQQPSEEANSASVGRRAVS